MKHLKPERLVLIGASTGGPVQIRKILGSLHGTVRAAIIIAQHMNAVFIPSFIKQINAQVPLHVQALEKEVKIEEGNVYIANGKPEIRLSSGDIYCQKVVTDNHHYNPDINHLFRAFAPYAGAIKIMAVIMTGIGDDGAQGCLALFEQGATCIAQSEKSAIVYGMPQRAKEMVEGIEVQSLEEIIDSVRSFAR